jgi:predicted nuclease of predicted toxin-antitoxin system
MRFAADENLNGAIVRGLLRRRPDFDIIRVQDTDLTGEDDPLLLEWAAQENRILLTHDVNTLIGFAYERVRAGLPMTGVLIVDEAAQLGMVIEDLLLINECSLPNEWENQVHYLPLR